MSKKYKGFLLLTIVPLIVVFIYKAMDASVKEQNTLAEIKSNEYNSNKGNNYIYQTTNKKVKIEPSNFRNETSDKILSVEEKEVKPPIKEQKESTPSNKRQKEVPDPAFIMEFHQVQSDISIIRNIWFDIKNSDNITKSELNKLNNFCRNVKHLADKSNPSYNCLDSKNQNIINSWLTLSKEIQIKIHKFQVIEHRNNN